MLFIIYSSFYFFADKFFSLAAVFFSSLFCFFFIFSSSFLDYQFRKFTFFENVRKLTG